MTALTPPERQITRADLDAKFGEVKHVVDEQVGEIRHLVIGAGIAVVVVLVVATFFLGRRRGRKLATIIEVRRV
jgi:hypothetical protein